MNRTIHVANNKEIDFAGLGMLLTLAAVFAYLLFCGWTNTRWADRLRQGNAKDQPEVESQASDHLN